MIKYNLLLGGVTLLVILAFSATAFAPPSTLGRLHLSPTTSTSIIVEKSNNNWKPITTKKYSSKNNNNNNTKKAGGLDENVRTKLLSESIAPWRTLRLFLYGALGSGALIGGLVNLSSAAAVFAGAKEGDMNAEALNLVIDFGAVSIFAFLFKWDVDKGKELNQRVEEKIGKKKEMKKVAASMKEQEQKLKELELSVQVSTDGATQDIKIRDLQSGARQHMIIVAGPKKACRDALVGANLLKLDFAMSNILVVPYEMGVDPSELEARQKGFGDRPKYETQPYVARPAGEGWEEYVNAEMATAVAQNGEKARSEGIAIVVASTGNVIRRGVGKVPWRQIVEELEQSVKNSKKEASLF